MKSLNIVHGKLIWKVFEENYLFKVFFWEGRLYNVWQVKHLRFGECQWVFTYKCPSLCEEGLFVEYDLVGKPLNIFYFEQNLHCHRFS